MNLLRLLLKEEATSLGETWQHLLEIRGRRARDICREVSRALTLASVALAGIAALAQGSDEASAISPDATLEDVRIAAMLHTPLPIDEIDAAIAEGARKGEALSRQLRAEGLTNIRQRTRPTRAQERDLPGAWACRVRLTACIAAGGDGRHNERERSCNNDLEAERVACGESADGETEAERMRHFENCRDIANLTRRACIAKSESTRSMEAVLCRSSHNCAPLPNADAVRGAGDCGRADGGGEGSSRASQLCSNPALLSFGTEG